VSHKADLSHRIRADILRVASEVLGGELPSRREYVANGSFSERQIINGFGSWADAIASCHGNHEAKEALEERKREKFKYVQPIKDGTIFQKTILVDLASLFEKAGNPEFLSCVAMPDVHVEHMDPWAVNCFLEYLNFENPHIFLCMGDFLNAGGISHWPSDSLEPQRFVPEVVKARELLGCINGLLTRAVEKRFLCGNHCLWLQQFLVAGANPQLFHGIEKIGYDFSIPAILDLARYGFSFSEMNQIVRYGRAAFTHGLYTGTNHAKKHIDEVKASIFYGHCHDTKSFSSVGLEGPIIAQSLGCLADLNPKFLRGLLNNWEHAFGQFYFFRDGSFTHTVPKIQRGKMIVNGKLFSA
jgi:hypothetical protein